MYKKVPLHLITLKEGLSVIIAEQLPVRPTVTVVIGSNNVLRLVAVCAFGGGAEEDLSVTVVSRRADGERIEAVAVDTICLTCIDLPLECVFVIELV